MNIYLDMHSDKPLYKQIEMQIMTLILTEKLHVDSPMPSVRELSKALNISTLTVKQAYINLKSKGFLYAVSGKGTYVNNKHKEINHMDKINIPDTEDFGLSFSDEFDSRIKAVFADSEKDDIRAFAANVLIGNTPAKKLNENVNSTLEMSGFHVKEVQFKDGRKGRYILLFGRNSDGLCAYSTTSDKVYEALTAIIATYGEPYKWKKAINIRIRMNNITDNGGKAYSLEII